MVVNAINSVLVYIVLNSCKVLFHWFQGNYIYYDSLLMIDWIHMKQLVSLLAQDHQNMLSRKNKDHKNKLFIPREKRNKCNL